MADTSSVVGLSALARSRPADWHRLLRRGARSGRLDGYSIVSDLVGTGIDAAALPRSRRDLGRLRSARWCASVLGRHAGHIQVLGVTSETADSLEAQLIEQGGLAPSSARKVRAHLVQLRGCVARELGVAVPPIEPPTAAPTPWNPRLDWSAYGATREWLTSADRAACDLIATCHLRPSTVLGLRVRDVGDGGSTVRVPGRRMRHVLPVPTFLRADLAELARSGESNAPLIPGRSDSLSVVTLRRRFKTAGREALDADLDLRDLSDLATATLGPGSANPNGRRVALERIARRWAALEEPPGRDDSEPVIVPRERELRGRLERTEDRIRELQASASRAVRRSRSSKEAMQRSVTELTARCDAQQRSIQELRRETTRQTRKAMDGLSERLAHVEGRVGLAPKAVRRQAAVVAGLRREVASVRAQGAKYDRGLKRVKRALHANAVLTAALVMERAVANQPASSPGPNSGMAAGRDSPGMRRAEVMLRPLFALVADEPE